MRILTALFVATVIAAPLQAGTPKPVGQSGPYFWTTGQYQYDAADNVTAVGMNTFRYDLLNRVTSSHMETADTVSNQSFQYDPFGSVTQVTTADLPTGLATNGTTNHLDMTIASYDEAGNVSQFHPPRSAHTYAFRYDALNTVSEEIVDNTIVSYFVYTAGDERLRSENAVSGTVRWRLRGFHTKVLRDFQRSASVWNIARDYVYRSGSLLAAVTPVTVEHFTLDALDSPRLLTDIVGNRLAMHTYLPFGQELGIATTDGEPMKFTGHERDDDPAGDTNPLDYMHARYYAPSLLRFLSVDRASGTPAAPQSWNRYTYARNSPLKAVDPDGNRPAMLYGKTWDVEPGYGVVLKDGSGKIHVVVVGAFQPMRGSQIPNAMIWENVPVQVYPKGGPIVDAITHTPKLTDSNSKEAGGTAGWNLDKDDVVGVVVNRHRVFGLPIGQTFSEQEVSNAVSSIGDVRYSNQAGGSTTPVCDCAGFADQVFLRLGGFRATDIFGEPYDVRDWADMASGEPLQITPDDDEY